MLRLKFWILLLIVLLVSNFGFAKKYCRDIDDCNKKIIELNKEIKTLKKEYKYKISLYKKIITLYNKTLRENRNLVYNDGGFQRIYMIYRHIDKYLSKTEIDKKKLFDILIY